MKKKTLLIALVLLAAVAAAVYWFADREVPKQATTGRRGGDAAGRPVPVLAAPATTGDVDVMLNALGTVTARNTATVKPRVDGQLVRVAFREGQIVKAGDLLAEIDPRPLQVLLDQANGQLARDEALLVNAQLDLARYQGLLAKDSIASQQVDAQAALVRQDEGVVKSDRAQVDSAKLQLSFTRITAPVAGRLGLRQIDAGNMVHAADPNGLVVITETQPINVIFAIPADNLPAVLSRLRPGNILPVDAFDREGKTRLAQGRLLTVDNQIDVTTGTVKLKAEFANRDNVLFPNQFVNVALRVDTRHGVTLVPTSAVQRGTQGTFVYVIDATQTVSIRPVVLGPAKADAVTIEKGIAPGEQVVIDGADKLRQGAKVEVTTPGARDNATRGNRGPRGSGAPGAGRPDGATGGPRGPGGGGGRRAGGGDAPGGAVPAAVPAGRAGQ